MFTLYHNTLHFTNGKKKGGGGSRKIHTHTLSHLKWHWQLAKLNPAHECVSTYSRFPCRLSIGGHNVHCCQPTSTYSDWLREHNSWKNLVILHITTSSFVIHLARHESVIVFGGYSTRLFPVWYPDCMWRVFNVTTVVQDGISNIPTRIHANACCDQSIHNGMCYYYISSGT